MYSTLKGLTLAAGLAAVTKAHTSFTTLFINGENQGDGVCVRMPHDGSTSTFPIDGVTSTGMVCGRDGLEPVPFTCSAPQGASITFWWRAWADYAQPGSIDSSHMGPCAVYLKQTANMSSESGEGDGWFKIWEEDYDESVGKWCTDKLIDNEGFLTVSLPSGLPRSEYLVRPEILALHASTQGDPQFYVGCAQLHVAGPDAGALSIPAENEVSIPGHVSMGGVGLVWDVWNQDGTEYKTPGPAVYYPTSSSHGNDLRVGNAAADGYEGGPSEKCLLVNGGWCGVEVPSYADEAGCWNANENCWKQADECYDTALPAGYQNCKVWEGKCEDLQNMCGSGQFNGPPNAGEKLQRVDVQVPGGVSFDAWNTGSTSGDEPAYSVSSAGAAEGSTSVLDGPQRGSTTQAVAPTQGEVEGPPATSLADAPKADYGNGEKEGRTANLTASSSSTPFSSPAPTDSSTLKVSEDGRCGGTTGQTCEGSEFGPCCSKKGWCGSTRKHCSCGCQEAFGACSTNEK